MAGTNFRISKAVKNQVKYWVVEGMHCMTQCSKTEAQIHCMIQCSKTEAQIHWMNECSKTEAQIRLDGRAIMHNAYSHLPTIENWWHIGIYMGILDMRRVQNFKSTNYKIQDRTTRGTCYNWTVSLWHNLWFTINVDNITNKQILQYDLILKHKGQPQYISIHNNT